MRLPTMARSSGFLADAKPDVAPSDALKCIKGAADAFAFAAPSLCRSAGGQRGEVQPAS